ncbi:hypothetical protein ACH5RR_033923 [Cinchona calisaya]|uniref:Peptidase A1 domain-containing protein n=1 Tax=Cinchona calisaya TaxID=153742 RepID=A0ABD2YCD2_9GENT
MAMALTSLPTLRNRLSLLKSLFFWLICSSVAISRGVEEAGTPQYHVVNVSSLIPKPYCTGHSKGSSSLGSQKLVVVSKNGPCSTSSHTKQISAYVEALMGDEARVQSLNSNKVSNLYSKDAASDTFHGGEYLTTIGLGTPKVDHQMIMDTGSDYTWVHCQSCSEGCRLDDPQFDPSKSSTYSNGSCKMFSGNDPFKITYYKGTNSTKHWGCDKLSLEPSDVFENFQFGCGFNNGGDYYFGNELGVLGLGRGDLSLVSQTASKFHYTFSYCLPKTSSSEGYLQFGDRARSATSSFGLQYTSLIKQPSQSIPSFYFQNSLHYVQLLGISVAGIRLNVPSTVFTSKGTVIDSRTVITYLPESVYNALRTAFNLSMAQYPPATPTHKNLDTCYNVKGFATIRLPHIVFHFGSGTDVSLNPSGIVYISQNNTDVWCLGFAANKNSGDLTIIGNNQQRELYILYDIGARRIGFGKTPCGS